MRTETNTWVSRKALGILKEDAADTDLFLSSFETRTLSLSPPCSKQHVTLLNTESIIIPIPKTIQEAPHAKSLRGSSKAEMVPPPTSENPDGLAPFPSHMTKAEFLRRWERERCRPCPRGGTSWGRGGRGHLLEVAKQNWVQCATINPPLGSWPGGARPPTEPALEAVAAC